MYSQQQVAVVKMFILYSLSIISCRVLKLIGLKQWDHKYFIPERQLEQMVITGSSYDLPSLSVRIRS